MGQYQLIAINRIYDYTSLPEEREEQLPTDKTFHNEAVTVPRASKGELRAKEVKGRIEIAQVVAKGGMEVGLRQIPDEVALGAAKGKLHPDLAPSCAALRGMDQWHRVAAALSAYKPIEELTHELGNGDSPGVVLHIES